VLESSGIGGDVQELLNDLRSESQQSTPVMDLMLEETSYGCVKRGAPQSPR
jgi:hypothetical protein